MVIKNCGTLSHSLCFDHPSASKPSHFQISLYNATLSSPLESACIPYSNPLSHNFIVGRGDNISVRKVPQRRKIVGSSLCEYRRRPCVNPLSRERQIGTHQKSKSSTSVIGVSIIFLRSLIMTSSPCSRFWHPAKRATTVLSSSKFGFIGIKKQRRLINPSVHSVVLCGGVTWTSIILHSNSCPLLLPILLKG